MHMLNQSDTNKVIVTGAVSSTPVYSHCIYGESFFSFALSIPRLSGTEDVLPVTMSERLMDGHAVEIGNFLKIEGQLRSYNKLIDGANRLIITVFAQSVSDMPEDCEPINDISIEGYLCKPVVFRTTPFSREIADILIAVNRAYNKSDYLPCIAWGRNAKFAEKLTIGTRICVNGRVQSREYQKTLPGGCTISRTAYEISATSLMVIE